MGTSPKISLSHVGVCVSDMQRSIRFYTETLGFALAKSIEAGAPFDVLAELPQMKLRASFLTRDGNTIELICYDHPSPLGPAERRPMNQLGLTHIAVIVDNLDAAVELIVKRGGRVYPKTRVETAAGKMVFCSDPDGTRIEVWQKP